MKKSAILFTAVLFLAGCAHYEWVNPSGRSNDFPADSYNCKQQALSSAPPVFQTYVPGPYYYDGPQHPPGYPPPAVDLNERTRSDLYYSCLEAHGWMQQRVEEPK